MEDGVEEIGNAAFQGCTSLRDLHIADTVWNGGGNNQMGWNAFDSCNIVDLVVPAKIKNLVMWEFASNYNLRSVLLKSRDSMFFGARPFNNVPISTMISLTLNPISVNMDYKDSNNFGGMTLYVPYGMVEQYEAQSSWQYYIGKGMQIQELTYDIDDNIYVKIDGYHENNPYIVDPENPSWGTSYIGTLVESGDYAGYYSFNGIVGVTDNKPLEIRDGSISGNKVCDITLRYEETVYEVERIYGLGVSATQNTNSFTRGVVLSAPQEPDNIVTQAEYDRLKCDVNSLKIKMNKLLGQ